VKKPFSGKNARAKEKIIAIGIPITIIRNFLE
jgi:hypothetical protein